MQIIQSGKFKKAYKKLHANQRTQVNEALKTIIANPLLGEQKKGNLSWLRVYKCHIVNQLVLIGYMVDNDQLVLTFVSIGPHENFYDDLKH